jgi:hypothetical protein
MHPPKPEYYREEHDRQHQHPPSSRTRPLHRCASKLLRRMNRRHSHSLHRVARHAGRKVESGSYRVLSFKAPQAAQRRCLSNHEFLSLPTEFTKPDRGPGCAVRQM